MANKKINQLVSKTAILSTDIFGIGDATTGQLFKKTIAELQAAIGGAVISVNGLVGTVVLDTDDIQELATPTNKYFTDARARGAISLTVTGNSGASTYSSGTGVLNVPTYTLAGLGGITATFLSGTSGISYNSTTGVITYSGTVYTDASIRALLSGGTGITYNSSTGAISYSGTVYTDSSVRALISMTTTGNSGASTYNNTTGVINVPNYTLAGLGGISLTSLSGGTGITYNSSTGAISYSGTVYTDASVRALISSSGAVSYNNTTGVISLTSGNLTESTSSVLTITGGTGAVLGSGTSIQVSQASTSVSGFLSSTDWNTFNGKASALSGTTNYVAKFTSSTAIGNSQIFDNGTYVGIGTITPIETLTIGNNGGLVLQRFAGGNTFSGDLYFYSSRGTSSSPSSKSNNDTAMGIRSRAFDGTSYLDASAIDSKIEGTPSTNVMYGNLIFSTNNGGTSVTERMRINSAGKVLLANGGVLGINTADESDNSYLALSGGANDGPSRGGTIYLSGNERADEAGSIVLQAGTTTFGTSPNGVILLKTSATTRLMVTSDGNLGFGVTPFTNTLGKSFDLVGGGGMFSLNSSFYLTSNSYYNTEWRYKATAGACGVNLNSDGSISFASAASGTINTAIPFTEKMRITSAGYLLLGTTSSYFGQAGRGNFEMNGSTDNIFAQKVGDVIMNYIYSSSSQTEIYSLNKLRLSGGNVLLNTTTDNGERLYVNGAIRATGTITANSDIRIKSNISKIENALEKVGQISGYTYNTTYDDKRHGGVIAQEIDKVFPEIVNTGNDGLMGVEYGNISALLIEAIKEQNIKIKNLETLLASK